MEASEEDNSSKHMCMFSLYHAVKHPNVVSRLGPGRAGIGSRGTFEVGLSVVRNVCTHKAPRGVFTVSRHQYPSL
jgi:hypothetical protein